MPSKARRKKPGKSDAKRPGFLSRFQAPAKATRSTAPANHPFLLPNILLCLLGISFAALGQWIMVRYSIAGSSWFRIHTTWWSLGSFLVGVLLFCWGLRPWKREGLKEVELDLKLEGIFLGAILLIALFFRTYQLDQVPNGIFIDQGFEGLAGLMISHNNFDQAVYSLDAQPIYEVGKPFWKQPFFLGKPLEAPSYLLYLLALWFKVFPGNQWGLYLFFAMTAMAAFPLIYWTFRQLAGPRMALLTLYLLAVMRWHVNFSRNGFPTIEVPLYMFGTLAFLLYGYRNSKTWALIVSSVFFSLGLYTYQAFKIFPLLLVVYALYEFLADRQRFLRTFGTLGRYFLGLGAWLVPTLVWRALNHDMSRIWLGILPLLLLAALAFWWKTRGKKASWKDPYALALAGSLALYLLSYPVYFTVTKSLPASFYLLFPLLLIAQGLYEWRTTPGKRVLSPTWAFLSVMIVLTSPLVMQMVQTGSIGSREGSDNILTLIREKHSLQPMVQMVTKTFLMCNREGDDNERHDLPNYRMLDDISAALFLLGLGYALSRVQRRKYFYAVMGLAVMSLACLLSVVPAHSNRMLATTPFICFLIASPLAALWARARRQWGALGEGVLLFLLIEPLMLIGVQNFHMYFHVQPANGAYWNTSFWGGYSYDSSLIGKMIAQSKENNDYYVDTRHYRHNTLKFLAYDQRDRLKEFAFPGGLAPLQTPADRGMVFSFLSEQKGTVQILQSLYPDAQVETVKAPNGSPLLFHVKVPAKDVAQAKGLRMRIKGGKEEGIPAFPGGLPPGPYQADFIGCIYLDRAGFYQFDARTNGTFSWSVGGHPVVKGKTLRLAKGFYKVEAHLRAPAGPVSLDLSQSFGIEKAQHLTNANFTTLLDLGRGLRGSYYDVNLDQLNVNSLPALEEWEPCLNFYNNFPYANWRETAIWTGTLEAPLTGTYQFTGLTEEFLRLKMDGKEVIRFSRNNPTGTVHLVKGVHKIEVVFQKDLGPSLVLYWRTPDSKTLESIPTHLFGFAN